MKRILCLLLLTLLPNLALAAPQQHVVCDSGCTGGTGTSNQGARGAASNSWPFYLVNADGTVPLMLTAPGTPSNTSAITIQGNASGVPVPVSGTVAATKSGTWNIDSILSLPAITFASPQHVIVDSGAINITTDGTAATGVSQDAGGSGAIGWLSSIVKNVRLMVTALQGTLTVQFASAQHIIVDAGSNVIGHIIVDSGSVTVANPGPTSAGGFPYVQVTALPNPLSVTTPPPDATPIPRPTDTAGNIIAVTPANYSTPVAVSVAATACPGNCLTVTAPYAGSVSFNITGLTGLGATVTFKASNDNVTFTSVNVVRELNNAVSSTTTTDGIYKIDATNGEYISAQVTTAGSGSMNISYASKNAGSVFKVACVTNCATPIPYPTNSNSVLKTAPDSVNDPCSVPANYLGTAFNLSATDTTLVTHSAATKIYICSFTVNNTVATGNTRLRYGTTTTTPCDTGGVNLYNSGLAVDGANYSNAGWPQFVAVPANNDLCITFTGSGGVAAGSLTYVQQ